MARTAWALGLLSSFFSFAIAGGSDRIECPEEATIPRVLNERKELINRLVELVRTTKPLCNPKEPVFEVIRLGEFEMRVQKSLMRGDPEIKAIQVLGELRATEAVYCLLEVIDLSYFRPVSCNSGDCEVIQALTEIGKPASRAAVLCLAADDSEKRAAMYVRVIANVEGVELARHMVHVAAEKEQDPIKKDRLVKALVLFKDAWRPIP